MERLPGGKSQEKVVEPHLEGCQVSSKRMDAQGLEHSHLTLDAGSYNAAVEFRPFGRFEGDWFSAATDNQEAQERPLKIDFNHPDVVQFAQKLFAKVPATPNDQAYFENLNRAYTSMLPSASLSKYEHYDSLSDIVCEGNGTCAAKTLLIGTLLSHRYPNIHAQEIYGQTTEVKDRVPHPFGHEWLRVESDKYVFLYDAMYSKTACFEKQPQGLMPIDEKHQTFQQYSVEAWPITAMYSKLKFSSISGNVRLVDTYDGKSKKFFLKPQDGFDAQADGVIYFSFDIPHQSSLELVNGHIQTKTTQGAGLYYPVKQIVRTK